ncbi:MAG TPA: hypothetical protein GX005_04380 [Bacteroidales bacterium]|nr:hypothetical protein [Bacteroidales bacterium]
MNIILCSFEELKALIGTSAMEKVMSLPENYEVEVIRRGCCGMAEK